jgi:hypothetical protein
MSTEIAIAQKQELVFKEMSTQIQLVLAADINSIQTSLVVANSIAFLRDRLTPEIMAPIMALQGSKLGFKTDKDLVRNQNTNKYEKGPGYPLEIVRDCFIEMSLIGLLPTSNMWNIIGGNSYPTKEGATYLLKSQSGLEHAISFVDVKQSEDKMTANVKSVIKWEFKGKSHKEEINFPVKSDKYTTFDALIGKADRKAKMWLYNKVSGRNVTDGEVEEGNYIDVKISTDPLKISQEKERARVIEHIERSKTIAELERCKMKVSVEDNELYLLYDEKKQELTAKK